MDSRLVANQVNGTYVAKEADMIRYLEKVKALTGSFKAFTIKQIPRSENKKADALSKIASTSFTHQTEETLPMDMKKARAIRRKSWRFAVINGILYKKSFLGPWLWCVGPLQANYVLREIHEGSCSMYAGTRSVVAKALRSGSGKVKFLIVAMDYFIKWIKAKPVATIKMKQLIAELPMLMAPMEKQELIVYLAATKETVSAVLMTEREAKQMPIYFVSRALRGPKINYTSMEKLVLALVHASKRLKRYFQAHPIIVITTQPIQQILSRPEVAGRLQKWSIKLGEYAIHYRPRVSVKGQILADFIVERPEEDSPDTPMEVEEKLPEP
ncbi:reverse transcriptase domain-containing protein [Tanacetum coccineum]